MENKVNSTDRGHSPWGASSAERWMNCPGSINLIKQAPPQKDSKYAAEGTASHDLAEKALLEGKPCSDFIGETITGWEITEEMAEFTQVYVDYVLEAAKGPNKDLLIEESFELDFIRKGMFGYNDAIVLEFMGTIEVIDLKYGKGKVVEADHNKQLKYYALGAAHGSDFKKVKLTIVQPRVQDPIKTFTMSLEDLEAFGEELGQAVDKTKDPQAEVKCGEWCFFCPAKSICPAKKEEVQQLAIMDFGLDEPKTTNSLPKAELMDAKTLRNVLEHAKGIKEWLDSVSAFAMHKLEQGKHVSGYKLVKGRVNRKVQSVVELEMAFGQEIYEKKLLGIGKLEKAFGKKEVAEFLFKPEAKLTMAQENDKREEVLIGSAAAQFGITDEDKPSQEANIDNFNNFTF